MAFWTWIPLGRRCTSRCSSSRRSSSAYHWQDGKALAKMKPGKFAGPSGIHVEIVKAAGSKGIGFLRELIKSVVKHGKIPEDWEMSFILNLYKGKGDALNRGNYRGLKLIEHVMNVMERIVDGLIREMIAIDEMKFAFVPGRGTTDWFIIWHLQEKDLNDKILTLFLAFVDLEKAFDRVPRKVLWWAMRKVGVEEWIMHLVQAVYNKQAAEWELALSIVRNSKLVLGYQGSVLCPLIFIIVLEALSRDFRVGCPGSCSLQVISWSLLPLLRNVLNVSRRGRRDWNPRVFM